MNYFFDCPYCNQSFEVEAELAGLNCVCTGCGEVFVVPSPPRLMGDVSAPRLDDTNDMRPEVWVPDQAEENVPAPRAEDGLAPHAPQYAGDALVGDQFVPVNFVPTGMETLPEVYGMVPEPGTEPNQNPSLPAEVKVRRVTPMMIENAGVNHPDARTGVVRNFVGSEQQESDRPVPRSKGGFKYGVIGVAAGIFLAWFGMRVLPRLLHGGAISSDAGQLTAATGSQREPSETEQSDLAKMEPANRFPDGFMGIKFGSKIEYIPDRVTWSKEGENLHKPATLADERVQAVLIPDHDGRLTVGAYVRLSDKADNELVPFLEWALTVQDAVTSKFGRPKSVHVVRNAATETEIVRKIRGGEDFYECIWEDPFNQCMVTLTVSGRNAKLIVFRLEYKSIPLTRSYLNRKAAN